MTSRLLLVLAAVVACGRDAAPTPTPPAPRVPADADAAPAPAARWIARTWEAFAIDARAPEIRLCDDGSYLVTSTYDSDLAPPKTRSGRACCRDAERGRYDLVRDDAGTITAVRFEPAWSADPPPPAPYEVAVTNDELRGHKPTRHARQCR